jgi:2-methylisocitrate lyase-like PEP mutase family enzyme
MGAARGSSAGKLSSETRQSGLIRCSFSANGRSQPANPLSLSFDLVLNMVLSAFCRGIVDPKGRQLDKHSKNRQALVDAIKNGATLIVPGAHDAISAKLIERHQFPAVYVGSYATSAARLGLPDVGLVSMNEMVDHARSIVDAVNVPVIADGENGWFNAANLWRTVRYFESAGVAAIHIEDHEFGKHAPVRPRLASLEQSVSKIRAAVEARQDPNFLIIARSDALWVTGDLDEVIRRLNAYADAGADLVMPTRISPKVLAECRSRIKAQVIVTDKVGFSVEDEMQSGASVVLYYGLSLYASYHGVKAALDSFAHLRDADKVPHLRDHIEEFETFMDYESFARRAGKFGVE